MSSQVGVRTRAGAALAMEAATASSAQPSSKRKKIYDTNHVAKLSKTPRTSSSSFFIPATVTEIVQERCLSPTSSEIPASCCSSNGSIGLDEDRIKLLDLEVESAQVETSTCNGGQEIERSIEFETHEILNSHNFFRSKLQLSFSRAREMKSSSELRENSQEPEPMEINSHRALSKAKAMPTELELEEFFVAAEKDIQKRFQDKYNYDIVKDVPLEGRYEWVQLKP
ncbi:Cyclin-dependent kinase inhibitor 7 [Glycine soja]|nr:Cyclin-dependent kinase inhibitor 7 [Glycine soja]